jgi:hypothetical protein
MDRDIRILALAAAAAAILAPALAAAQVPAAQVDPKACANSHATVGEGGGLNVQKQPGSTLSDKLAQSNGVICPPMGVDPEIHEPAPSGGSIKVIPPPGSPGGNPDVQPK